ncbi:MAG TPA: hypothetical protein PK402_09830, partial [Tepidisphaeraceae bacterium]|nr:hypothetical protein [Tepidisphaeraceae bacterium]
MRSECFLHVSIEGGIFMRKLLKRCRPGFPIESLELRRLLAAVGFDGGGDGVNWNDPLNWSNNALPTSNDDVTLAPGGEVIQPLNVSLSVKSIQANRPLKVAQAFSIAESAIFNSALTPGSTSGSPGLFVGGDLTTNGTVTIARS